MLDLNTRAMAATNDVRNRAETAWARAERIAADQRLTVNARNEDISALMQTTVNDIESYAQPIIAELEAEIQRLELAATTSIVPSPTEIAQAAYVRDLLANRWQTMTIQEALEEWRRAIASGDRIVARVCRDFFVPVWQEKQAELLRPQFPHTKAAEVRPSLELQELVERTTEMLSTPEELKARLALEDMRTKHEALTTARISALSRLNGTRYNPQTRALESGWQAGMARMSY